MLKIGDITCDVPFFQASLSGYSDRAMRVIAKRYGAPLTLTGVMLDKLAIHPKAVKKMRFQPGEDEHPVGAQILGANPDTMAAAAAKFESIGYDLIDLNFACPAPKVLRRGRGGALLTKPELVNRIFRKVRDAVKCPVMMKLRVGFDGSEASREDFWRICEESAKEGADALVIHGRTVVQKYRKTANWDVASQVKQRFPDTTILGSGDLLDAETVAQRIKTSGLDGVIIARGAIGNPWIFSEARALLEGKPKPPAPDITEQGRVLLDHFKMVAEIRPAIKAIRFFRKFAVGYCKRHPQRKKVQMDIMAAKTYEQMIDAIKQWYGIEA